MDISIVIPYEASATGLTLYSQVRREDGPLDGMMEFPGGKVEAGENSEQAARREFYEEVGVELNKITLFTQYRHDYDDRSVILFVYLTDYTKEMSLESQKIPFENAQNKVEELNIPAANKIIIMRLIEHYLRESNFNE